MDRHSQGVFQVTANDTDDPTSLGTRLTKAYSGHSTSLIAVPRASPLIVTVDGLVLDTSLPTENEIYKARKTSPNLKRLDVSFWNSMLVINGTGTTISHQHPSDYRIETAEKLFPDYRASETVIANRGPNLCAVDREKFTCVDPAFSQTVISFLRPSLEAAPTRVAFSEASNTFAVITSGGKVAVYAQAEPQPDHQINEEFGLPVEATELFFLDETLLIGATTGLYFSSPPYSTIESLDYGKNTRVLGFRQAHGGVYVLTETGASYIELSNIRSWPGSEQGRLDVLAFAETKAGTLLIGTNQGLFNHDVASDKTIAMWAGQPGPVRDLSVTAIAEVGNCVYWGTFASGVMKLCSPQRSVSQPSRVALTDQGITALMATKSKLLATTSNGQLFEIKVDKMPAVSRLIAESEFESPITSIRRIPGTNTLVLSTERSVLVICEKGHSIGRCDEYLFSPSPSRTIIDLLAVNSSTLIAASLEGELLRLKLNQHATSVTSARVIRTDRSRRFFGLSRGFNQTTWVATDNGIMVFDEELSPIRVLGIPSGLRNREFHHGARETLRSGALVFGGTNGSDIIYPGWEDTRKESSKTKIFLSQALIEGRPADVNSTSWAKASIRLKRHEKRLEIVLSQNDFRSTANNTYAHQLLGLEKDWIETGPSNTVTYTNLPPGEYLFKARGAGPDGIWSTNTLEIPVIVDYPWWRTYWACALYAALVVLALRQLKQLNEERVTRELKLKHAAETEIALQRLEDSFQAQQERNQAVEQSASENSNATLGLIGLVNEALSTHESLDRKARFDAALESIQIAEALGENRISGKTVGLQKLANEVGNQIQKAHSDIDLIFVNDVPEVEVDETNAKTISVVLSELLKLGVHRLENETDQPVLLHLNLGVSPLDEDHRISYSINIDGNPKNSSWAKEISKDAPITKLITEQIAGEIPTPADAEPLQISLLLDAP